MKRQPKATVCEQCHKPSPTAWCSVCAPAPREAANQLRNRDDFDPSRHRVVALSAREKGRESF